MNLNFVFSKSMNLNFKIRKKMNGSNPNQYFMQFLMRAKFIVSDQIYKC